MRKIRIEELKEKMDSVETNLAIYKNDLTRFEKKLKKVHGLDTEDIEDRPVEIEEEIEKLEKRRRRLLRKIDKGLDDVGY